MPVDPDELVEILAHALWCHLDLRPRRRSLDDARLWARKLVEHLDACGIECRRPPAPPLHGTPSY